MADAQLLGRAAGRGGGERRAATAGAAVGVTRAAQEAEVGVAVGFTVGVAVGDGRGVAVGDGRDVAVAVGSGVTVGVPLV